MRKAVFKVVSNRALTRDVFEMVLEGDVSGFSAPGQFVEISIPGLFLRRPISVCNATGDSLVLIVRAVGAGTAAMRAAAPGTEFDLLVDLGNGFDVSAASARGAVLVGGGIGIAPLYGLAARMPAPPRVVLGFRNAADSFYIDAFRALGCETFVATEDGSLGDGGVVTDVLSRRCPDAAAICACGPLVMMRALCALPQVEYAQLSLEARMGCGFGACVGCTVQTTDGPKRVCADGPVFLKETLQW